MKKKPNSEAIKESTQYFLDNVLTPFWAYIGLFVILGFALGPYELHQKDLAKIAHHDQTVTQIKDLKDQLELARNNVDVSSTAANNLMYAMQAFRGYRAALGGFKPVTCEIRLTAPPESTAIAMTISEFSIQVTNCQTFGPMAINISPDEERETVTGMVTGKIVFHCHRNDKAAFELYGSLSNLLPLKMSYDIPSGSPDNFIWLQLGPQVHWNSEGIAPQALR